MEKLGIQTKDVSDHLPCFLRTTSVNVNLHKRIIWDLKSTEWKLFNEHCKLVNFDENMDVDQIDKGIEDNILNGLKNSTKFYEYPNNNKRNPPWWDQEMTQLRKDKNKAL